MDRQTCFSVSSRSVALQRLGLGLLLVLLPAATGGALTLDEFTEGSGPISNSGFDIAFGPGDILGNERRIEVERFEGAGDVTVSVAAGQFSLTQTDSTPDTRGQGRAIWAGSTGMLTSGEDKLGGGGPGLGGVDLTVDGQAFRFVIAAADADTELIMLVTSAGGSSLAALRLPAVAAATDFILSFSSFVTESGAGADFTSVDRIEMRVQGVEKNISIDLIDTVAPAVEVTMADLRTNDADIGVGTVGPGDQIKYRITVTNTGGDATGLNVDFTPGLDTATSVSSVATVPIARDDTYEVFGNASRTVMAGAGGVIDNDADPDGDSIRVAIASSDTTSAAGGTIAWNDVGAGLGDGQFTYSAPAGFRGVDTFTYTAVDDDSSTDTATVNVLIENLVWFVDNTHGGADLGTLADPFQSISGTNLDGAGGAGDMDGPGDVIYFFTGSGTYAGGLELERDQQVFGPEDGLTLDGSIIVPDTDDARPTLAGLGGNAIDLARDNTIRGLDLGSSGANLGLAGSNFGTLTVSDMAISGSGGVLDLDQGTLAVTLDSVAATGGSLGIEITNADGSFTTGSTTLNGISGTAVRTNTSTVAFNFGATSIGQTTAVSAGVQLIDTAPSTYDFSSLTVTTNAGSALVVNNAGTVEIAGAANTLAATGGSALDVILSTFDGAFTSATANSLGGADPGIRLSAVADANAAPALTIGSVTLNNTTGSGIALLNNTGEVQINGGTVGATLDTGDAANPAIDIEGGAAAIGIAASLTNTTGRAVEITGRTGGAVTISGNLAQNAAGTGILVALNTGGTSTFSGGTKTLNSGANTAVTVTNSGGHTTSFTGGGLDIDTTTGIGFLASGGGTVNSSGAGNTITTTANKAIDIDAMLTGLTFASLSSTGSANQGIELTNLVDLSSFQVTGTTSVTNAGSEGILLSSTLNAAVDLDFTGVTTVDNAGTEGIEVLRADTNGMPTASDIDFGVVNINNRNGTGILLNNVEGTADFGVTTIANPNNAGGYGIRVEDSSALVTVATANISDTTQTVATADGGAGVPSNDGDGDAIFLKENTGGFTANGGTLGNLATDGIDLRNAGNLTLVGVTIEDIGTASANPATIPDAGIFARNLRGTNLLRDSVIQRAQTDDIDEHIRIRNIAQTIDELRLNNTDIINTTAGSPGGIIRGANGLSLENRGAMDATVIVENGSDFTGVRLNAIAINSGDGTGAGSGTINIVVDGSTLDPNGLSVFNGGAIEVGAVSDIAFGIQDDYTVNYNIHNTTIRNVQVGGTLAGVLSSVSGDLSAGGPGPSVIGRVVDSSILDIRGRRGINLISQGFNQSYSVSVVNTSIQDLRNETVSGAALFGREAFALATRNQNTIRELRLIGNNFGAGPNGVINSTLGSLAGDDLPVGDNSNREAVDLLLEDSSRLNALVHNSTMLVGALGAEVFEIDVENSTALNLTVTDNILAGELDVASASEEVFLIDTEAAGASAALDLDNNTSLLGQEWEIDENSGGPITIESRADVTTRNTGPFNFADTISDHGSDVPLPGAVVIAGSGRISQIAAVSTPYLPLIARANNPDGTPATGVTVTFAAPGAGASGTFPSGNTCVTDGAGSCSVQFTANATPGAFQVTAGATILAAAAEGAIYYLRNLP